jgi:hypothetical protein
MASLRNASEKHTATEQMEVGHINQTESHMKTAIIFAAALVASLSDRE